MKQTEDAGAAGFDVADVPLAALRTALDERRITSEALVKAYRARIAAIDRSGPSINSVIEENADALTIARALDREREAGRIRGPLHGIPILIKDNIATADRMQTTAGSLALIGARPPRDATVVARLRAAGAVLLGKTNLSEWANIRSTRSTSGWSARGGLTRNPYALDRNTSGSSSGSAAAIAASLAAVAVGTETDGSIISPSNMCSLVGIKPTLGLVSRHGIIPIARSQDTAGPMARTVADAAVLLSVLAGGDDRDPITADADRRAIRYETCVARDGLRGARLGVVRANFGGRNDLASAVVDAALERMRDAGAMLVDVEIPNAGRYATTEIEVLLTELKVDIASYLATFAPDSPLRTLADLIAFNERERDREMRWFGQELFIRADATQGLESAAYREALALNHRYTREEGIDQVLRASRLDALVAPSGGLPWLTDFYKGDNSGGGFTQPAAIAGYPHITVPGGYVHGLPVGLSFVGTAWSEPTLIRIASGFEHVTQARRPPMYPKSVNPDLRQFGI